MIINTKCHIDIFRSVFRIILNLDKQLENHTQK